MQARPTCAVCQREVDEIMTYYDQLNRTQVYVVRCHGAEQVEELPDHTLVGATAIEFGQAFARPALKS